MAEMTTTPSSNGEAPMAKRAAVRTLLPSTWLQHEVKLEYRDGDGKARHTSGTFLDWCPTGPILNCDGTRTVFVWERLVTVELVAD